MANSFKNLNIGIDEVRQYLEKVATESNGKCEIKNPKVGFYQFLVEISGNKVSTLNIFETKNGLTISPDVGANQKLSLQLATEIAKIADKVKTNSQSFESITENIFDEFLQHLEADSVDIQKTIDDDTKKIYKLKDSHKLETTVTYFKTTHKVFIQGKDAKLFKDVILWFTGKVIKEPEEIIKIVFNSIDDFNKYKIDYSDNIIEDALKKEIGAVYNDTSALQNEERTWLKVSFYLLKLDINLPEYYPAVAGSIKVIEGILTRILLNKCGYKSFNISKSGNIVGFSQFTGNCKLGGKYKKNFNFAQCNLIENLYVFIRDKRHELSHNRGINPKIIQNKTEAEDIFKKIIDLIKNLNNQNMLILFK